MSRETKGDGNRIIKHGRKQGFGHLLSNTNNKNGGFGNQPKTRLELKLIFSRDEMAYLFGFDKVLSNQLSHQTGAEIHMTDGDCSEYVVAIVGVMEVVFKAFSLVCRKLWDFWTTVAKAGQQPLTVRLVVSSSQCGSIIGKHGINIKEMREMSGANILVSIENLPESTERCVEITGNGEACLQCAYHICIVLQDVPPRPDNVPYVPKVNGIMVPTGQGFDPNSVDTWKPVFLCGDKAYIIDGNKAIAAPPEMLRNELSKTPLGGHVTETLTEGLSLNNQMPEHMNPLTLMAAISSAHKNTDNRSRTSREMWVKGEMMSIVLASSAGRKLDEIQRMSGAQIHVAAEDEMSPAGDILVTVTGSEESVLLAQFLIQSNIDLAMKENEGILSLMALESDPGYPNQEGPLDNRPWGNRKGGGGAPNKSFRGSARGNHDQGGYPSNLPGSYNRDGFQNDRFQNNRVRRQNDRGTYQNGFSSDFGHGFQNDRGGFQNGVNHRGDRGRGGARGMRGGRR